MNNLAKIYTTIFFVGFIKWAPGTIGSFVSLLIISILNNFIDKFYFICLFIFLFIFSIKLIDIYSKNIKNHDSKEIIIDEFLGIYLIMIFFEYYDSINYLIKLTLIFIIFRFFDIIKLFPANWVDKKITNSYGVLLDDIIAAAYTIIVLFLINAII